MGIGNGMGNMTNTGPGEIAGRTQSVWFRNTGRGGAMTWFLQRITGLFIIIMVLLHIYMNHFTGTGWVTYEAVKARLGHPLWKCFDMAFLTFALYHGLAGAWAVAADYVENHGWRLFIFSALILLGGVLGCLGTITILGFPFD